MSQPKFIALGLFLILVLTSASRPLPHANTPPNTANYSDSNYGCGTQNRPCVVYVETSPLSQAEADRDANYQEQKLADKHEGAVGQWLVGVGIVQTLALIVTFWVMGVGNIRQIRAYVVPRAESIVKFSLVEPIEILIVTQNVGATPAKDYQSAGSVFVAVFPLPDSLAREKRAPPKEPLGRRSRLAIYPGATQQTTAKCIDILTPDIVAALMAPEPKAAIYVVDTAYYRDVAGRRRRTEFCRYIHPEDTAKLIHRANGSPMGDFDVRFVAAHILNDFT